MKKIVIANLKMNQTASETKSYMIELVSRIKNPDCEVVVCPPFTSLPQAKNLSKGTKIQLGAQTFCPEEKGSFTGEVSLSMLKDLSVKYVIIGHSERRKFFNESKLVNKKVKAALKDNFKIVLCYGETLAERKAGKIQETIKSQLEIALSGLFENELKNIVFAYEPVWAIGTGETASEKQIQEAIDFSRKTISEIFSEKISQNVVIVYGGSVKATNAKKIHAIRGVDGSLVGSASLNAEEFFEIVRS